VGIITCCCLVWKARGCIFRGEGKQLQANFGARCDAYAVGGQLYLKFELYGTFKGQNEAQTIDQFNDPVKNFADMQSVIKKKVPAIFNMITKSPQDACEAGGDRCRPPRPLVEHFRDRR